MKIQKKISVSELRIHPIVSSIMVEKRTDFIKLMMQLHGQETPISVVEGDDGLFYVIDGVVRLKAATELGFDELICYVIKANDDQIVDLRMRINQTTKTHLKEKCVYLEHILGLIGKNQGKRSQLGWDILQDNNIHTTIGKERFDIACAIAGTDFKGSTLRKLMEIYWTEKENVEVEKIKLIDTIDRGVLSIDKAHKLLKKYKKISEKKITTSIKNSIREQTNGWFQLYNQCGLDLSNLESGFLADISIVSPPYAEHMREYPNQSEFVHGHENTIEEYIENEIKFYNQIQNRMKANGVLVIIIGESYQNGYKAVGSRLEIALMNNGWDIIDVVIWEKENPTPARRSVGFQPSYEKIIVCKKVGGEPIFNGYYVPTSTGEIKISNSRASKDGSSNYYLSDDTRMIGNVIKTPVVNHSEYKGIDENYRHIAPAPKAIYKIFLEAYSNPGTNMNYLEVFSGSGQGLESALEFGLNAVGVEIDPVSVEFTRKRLSLISKEKQIRQLQNAA
jgi:DNA modification methylase